MLVDSHAHLSSDAFNEDRDEVLSRCRENGLKALIEIGAVSGFEGNESARIIAEQNDDVWFTVGLHPHDAKLFNEDDWKRIADLANNHPKVVGIGETGFDFFYNHSSSNEQEEAFVEHIHLARETGLPIVIHDREAHEETLAVLDREGAFETSGVFHCFSGDWSLAEKVIERGWIIALGGVVTFPKAEQLHEVAKRVPLESVVIETDCPYLTPVPNRGKRNEPWMVRFVAERIAALKGIDSAKVIEASGNNAANLYKIDSLTN